MKFVEPITSLNLNNWVFRNVLSNTNNNNNK